MGVHRIAKEGRKKKGPTSKKPRNPFKKRKNPPKQTKPPADPEPSDDFDDLSDGDLLFEDEEIKAAEIFSQEEESLLKHLARVKIELQKRKLALDPCQYGLPDLVAYDFSPREEQEKVIREVVTKLLIMPNGPPRPIHLLDIQLEFLVDLFYGHHRYAIIWKPRGGGGSLVIAILMWLLAVFRQKSCLDLAGSSEQSRAVYDYTKGFWEGLPELKRALLSEAPLKTETVLISGASIKCVPASERQVKSKHCPVLILDEACQKQAAIDQIFMDAIQGVFSEPDPIVVMNSTFYFPMGIFQEFWDSAESRGFKKYKWNIFSTMSKCESDDCFSGCPLSWQVDVLDAAGKATGTKQWVGCCGQAHESGGFQNRDKIIEVKSVNEGSNIFEVQHCGQRPQWMDTIYPLAAVQKCEVENITLDLTQSDFCVGIDWGLIGQTAVMLLAFEKNYDDGSFPKGKMAVVEAEFMTGKLTSEVMAVLYAWAEAYNATFPIFPDGSHPYNNLELERAGWEVAPVHFVKWKEYGIGNVRKYLVNNRIEIPRRFQTLLSQLKRYARTQTGKPKKREDHGPDALLAGLMCWPFLEWFGEKVEKEDDDNHQVILIGGKGGPGVYREDTPDQQQGAVMAISSSGGKFYRKLQSPQEQDGEEDRIVKTLGPIRKIRKSL